MTEPRPLQRVPAEIDAEFRASRIERLTSVNLNTFWSMAIILVAFGAWDYYADPIHWYRAFVVRFIGALMIAVTGLYQNLPGRERMLIPLSKVRLVIAAVTWLVAVSMLNRGYGFGVAGLGVILLTGTYIAIDARDLIRINIMALAATFVTMLVLPIERFEMIGTAVFLLFAAAISTLLGRVLEASNRRAFTLELDARRETRSDALTGLDNRRAMQERGRGEVKLARRTGAPVSVILCDFDHFKSINDQHGHEIADAALVKAGHVLRTMLRESDAIGRWSGAILIAVLPATHAGGAHEVGERMRKAIADTTFAQLPGGATISVGVATSEQIEDPALEWDLLIKEAEQRLYRAKHDGRNRVVSIDRPK